MKNKFKRPLAIAEKILNRIALHDENFSVIGDQNISPGGS